MAEDKVQEQEEVKPEASPGSPSPEVATVEGIVQDEKAREFTWIDAQGKSRKLQIRRPNNEEIQASDWEYARVFNEAIAEGIVPRAALINMLQERGINFDKQNEEIQTMQDELNSLIEELKEVRKKKDKDAVGDLKEDIKDLRGKLVTKRTAISDYTRNCAEQMANDARDTFVLATILEENSKPFFEVRESSNLRLTMRERLKKFQKDEYGTLRLQGSYEFMTFANGLASNFTEQFPENQAEDWDKKEPKKKAAASATK